MVLTGPIVNGKVGYLAFSVVNETYNGIIIMNPNAHEKELLIQ